MGNLLGNAGNIFTPTNIIILVVVVVGFFLIRAFMGKKRFGRRGRR